MEIIFWKWVIGVLLVLSSMATIDRIGKYREPITRGEAIFTTLINGWILYLIISL